MFLFCVRCFIKCKSRRTLWLWGDHITHNNSSKIKADIGKVNHGVFLWRGEGHKNIFLRWNTSGLLLSFHWNTKNLIYSTGAFNLFLSKHLKSKLKLCGFECYANIKWEISQLLNFFFKFLSASLSSTGLIWYANPAQIRKVIILIKNIFAVVSLFSEIKIVCN